MKGGKIRAFLSKRTQIFLVALTLLAGVGTYQFVKTIPEPPCDPSSKVTIGRGGEITSPHDELFQALVHAIVEDEQTKHQTSSGEAHWRQHLMQIFNSGGHAMAMGDSFVVYERVYNAKENRYDEVLHTYKKAVACPAKR